MNPSVIDDAQQLAQHPNSSTARWSGGKVAGRRSDIMPGRLERLNDVLDTVRRLCPDLSVLAITWFHVKHPILDIQRTLMQPDESRLRSLRGIAGRGAVATIGWIGAWLWQGGICVLYSLLLVLRVGRYRLRFRTEQAALARMRFDVVAKTWCFDSAAPTGNDFYYGDLQRRLARRGLRMLLLCGGAEDLNWSRLVNRDTFASGVFRIPEWCVVPLLAPLQMAAQQLRTSLRLRRVEAQAADSTVRRVARCASLECLSRDTTRTGVFFWIGRATVQQWRPKALITLYEGNSWEQCLWWGAKTADPSCRTVGYQHTVFFQESLALMRPTVDLPARSVPDVVLCLGEETRALMRDGHEPQGVHLLRFGGFRCFPTSRASRPADASRRTVLVTPEGLAPEVAALFGFALACARRLPAYQFILRCHPSFPMARVLSLVPGLRAQPNIVLSEHQRLDEDLARSSVLLYRGSSSALYAIAQGLLPVYVHVDAMMDVDPLFKLSGWRLRCETPEELAAILERDEQTLPEQREAEWRPAAAYVEAYTEPVAEGAIDELLRTVGVDRQHA